MLGGELYFVFDLIILIFPICNCGLIYEGCPKRSSSTGEVTYTEEIREEISATITYSEQISSNYIQILKDPLESSSTCYNPKFYGLVEYLDMGSKPIPWYTQRYIRTSGHKDVTNIATFGFLDAYGARLIDGKLDIIITDSEGFIRKDQHVSRTLLLHSETSSYGLGYNDSAGLSPPISINSILLNEFENILMESKECYCDVIVTGELITILGFVYYPQYGHTLLNTFSNYYALLKRKGYFPNSNSSSRFLSPDNYLILLHSLQRNTTAPAQDVPHTFYRIMWHEMYNELFSSIVQGISSWDDLLTHSIKTKQKICFERLMIGAPPHLDHLNASVPLEMWNEFIRFLISYYYEEEIQNYLHQPDFRASKDILTNQQLSTFNPLVSSTSNRANIDRCLVTFIVRSQDIIPQGSTPPNLESIHGPSRDIINLHELQQISESHSCQTQYLLLQHHSIKDQILELRWNTTLLVLSDGTALYNTLFMDECSSILRVETWRKPGIVPCLGSGQYWTYSPYINETFWMNKTDSLIGSTLHEYNQTDSILLEKMPLNSLEYPAEEIEQYLRDSQLTYVNPKQYESILLNSIRYYQQCSSNSKK